MIDYTGTIIEESLENNDILKEVKILSTRIENVTEHHKTPWLTKWTLHSVEIPEEKASDVADTLSESLERNHTWYADFKNENFHYIIFPGEVFKVNRKSKNEYEEVTKYGISLGIPDYQLDFSPDIK